MDTYSVKLDGAEMARVTGEGITTGKKSQFIKGTYQTQLVDDLKMLKLIVEGKTVLVFYVSSMPNVTVERIDG